MKGHRTAIVGLFFLVYVVPLGARPIVIPDEVRYAEVPREMLASGDWIVPRFNGLRYFEKPVLGYWLNAISMRLLGKNSFAVRLPSALSVGLSALILFLFVRRWAGADSVGMLAAGVFLSCGAVFGIGTFAVLDSVFSMFVTAAMISFFFAYKENRPKNRTILLALFGAFCGLAFLVKGFVAFAIPIVAIGPFLVWERRWKEGLRLAMVPVFTAILVALPWSIAIASREPGFWRYFFWSEHIRRFMGDDPQHTEPFWYYIPFLAGEAFPWTVFFPASVWGLRKTGLKGSLLRFALCWFCFPFVFFSLSRGKLGTYILPCFAPLAILVTLSLRSYIQQGKTRLFSAGAVFLATAACLSAFVLVLSQLTGFGGSTIYTRQEIWKWLLAAGALLIMAACAILAVRLRAPNKKILTVCVAPCFLMFSAHFLMPDQMKLRKAPGAFLLRHANQIRPDNVLVSDAGLAHAVCWFYRRSDVELMSVGEFEYGLQYPDVRRQDLDSDQLENLVRDNSRDRELVLVIDAERYAKYKRKLAEPAFEAVEGDFAFARFGLNP